MSLLMFPRRRGGLSGSRVCEEELFVDRVGRVGRLLAVLWSRSAAQDPNLPEPRDQRLLVL